jgi:hypothetical protein
VDVIGPFTTNSWRFHTDIDTVSQYLTSDTKLRKLQLFTWPLLYEITLIKLTRMVGILARSRKRWQWEGNITS